MPTRKLIFVDTNIWLDFYRARSEAGLKLLDHLEKISGDLISSYQLEMEFKKNRQAAIMEGFQVLKSPDNISRPGIFSDAKAVKIIQDNIKAVSSRVNTLKRKLKDVVENPGTHDPVFKAFHRILENKSPLHLTRKDTFRNSIRRRAFRRFLHGCPPRKINDTSFGDAFNWEWMIDCAIKHKAELVIVSRDADYGMVFDGTAYINDHLKQEFSERVGKRKKIQLYTRLSDALKHFKIPVTEAETLEEDIIITSELVEPSIKPSIELILLRKLLEGYSQQDKNP